MRERKRLLGDEKQAETVKEGVLVGEEGGEFGKVEGIRADKNEGKEEEGEGKGGKQEVYVLDGGFVKWQEKYGDDERLTEGWVRDIWEDGY